MTVVTEALLYSWCQEETAFILNYPIMAGHQLSRYVIQKILSFSVQLKATSWSIWKVKVQLCMLNLPCVISYLSPWTSTAVFWEFLSSLLFWIFDLLRGTAGCYDYYLLILFAVVSRSFNQAQSAPVLCAGQLLFSISPKPRLIENYLPDCKKTNLYYLAKIRFQFQVRGSGNISFFCKLCQPTYYGLPTFSC